MAGSKNLTRLNVALTATIGAFEKTMGKAVGSIQKLGDKVESIIKGPLGALAGIFTVGAFINGIKNASTRIDELAKSADRLGISTQALGGLQYAAEQTGSSAEQLRGGMERLTKTVQEAATGSKSAREALAGVGLEVKNLVGLSPDQQFAKVADAVKGLDTQGQRTAATMELFGKGNIALLNTLDLGSKGLADMAAEADKLGISVSRVDAAKVEEAGDAMANISEVVNGAFNEIMIAIAPFVTYISNSFIDAATSAGGFREIVGTVVDWLIKAAGFVADAWQGMKVIWKAFEVGFNTIGSIVATFADEAVRAAQWIGDKFVTAFDMVIGASKVMGGGVAVAWDALKVPVADFISFVGAKLRDLVLMAADAARTFDNDMADAMYATGSRIGLSTAQMGESARAELAHSVEDLKFQTAELAKNTEKLFAPVATTGSQILRDYAAAFSEVAAEQKAELSLMLGDEQASIALARKAEEIKAEAELRAAGRAAELAAQQEHQRLMAEAEAIKMAEREREQAKWLNQMLANNGKHTKDLLSGSSAMFANLSKMQETNSKAARRIGKIAAKAKIGTDTASAAMGAYSAMASIPFVGPALGIAAAAAAVAAGAIQLGNVDKADGGGGVGAAPQDVSTTNIGGVQAPAQNGQQLVLQGDSFSAESLVALFKEANERGLTISGVRRG